MTDTARQIKQMVNFIMQEAHEKVNEIRIKTEHDFNLEKQMLVHNGKLKIQEEYAQKEKDLEIQQRVSRSAAIGNARVKKMKSRDDLLEVGQTHEDPLRQSFLTRVTASRAGSQAGMRHQAGKGRPGEELLQPAQAAHHPGTHQDRGKHSRDSVPPGRHL